MDAVHLAKKYREHGFLPFPLSPGSKEPPAGSNLSTIDREWKFAANSNIGLFPGSPNGLVVIDADNEQSQRAVLGKLRELGLMDWVTIVYTPRRGGLHVWLKVFDVPDDAQAYYRLAKEVGGGEFRVRRNSYVVAPGSRIKEGVYKFIQGGIEFFEEQPEMKWGELVKWLLRHRPPVFGVRGGKVFIQKERVDGLLELPGRLKYRPRPSVLMLFDFLRHARRGDQIPRINYLTGEVMSECFASRSDAEAAIVTGLVLAGWQFDDILTKFEEEMPGHYAEVANKHRYLMTTYNNAVRYVTAIKG